MPEELDFKTVVKENINDIKKYVSNHPNELRHEVVIDYLHNEHNIDVKNLNGVKLFLFKNGIFSYNMSKFILFTLASLLAEILTDLLVHISQDTNTITLLFVDNIHNVGYDTYYTYLYVVMLVWIVYLDPLRYLNFFRIK